MSGAAVRIAGSLVVALVIAAGAGWAASRLGAPSDVGEWREIAWPFPRDAWPEGRAFQCRSKGCDGSEIASVRPKIGLCNCATGVADDAEVDGVADVDLWSQDFVARGPGTPISVGSISGRARDYLFSAEGRAQRAAVGVALSAGCDLVAVSASADPKTLASLRPRLAALVASPQVMGWLRRSLGER